MRLEIQRSEEGGKWKLTARLFLEDHEEQLLEMHGLFHKGFVMEAVRDAEMVRKPGFKRKKKHGFPGVITPSQLVDGEEMVSPWAEILISAEEDIKQGCRDLRAAMDQLSEFSGGETIEL
jgi:hypothetical protein